MLWNPKRLGKCSCEWKKPVVLFLLQFFVFVLHENGSRVDIDDADGVASAGGHFGSGLGRVLGVRLEHDLPYLWNKTWHNNVRHPIPFLLFYIRKLASNLSNTATWVFVFTVPKVSCVFSRLGNFFSTRFRVSRTTHIKVHKNAHTYRKMEQSQIGFFKIRPDTFRAQTLSWLPHSF